MAITVQNWVAVDKLLSHFENIAVGHLIGASFAGLEEKDFSLYCTGGIHGQGILCLHRLLDGELYLFYE